MKQPYFPLPTASPLSYKQPDWDEITRIGWLLKRRRFAVIYAILYAAVDLAADKIDLEAKASKGVKTSNGNTDRLSNWLTLAKTYH